MKCKRLLVVILSIAMTSSVACGKRVSDKAVSKYNIEAKAISEPVEKISSANNKMAFKMLKATFNENKNKNTVISPMSLSTILSITQNGAAASTKEEMQKAMELLGIDDKTINEEYKNIIANFNSIEALQVKMANSIWIAKGMEVKDEFKNTGRDYYEAEISEVDFSKSETTDTINKWMSDHTAGKIKKVVDKFDDAEMALINTLYFKGDFAVPFAKKNTRNKEFNLSNGTIEKIDMMHGNINVDYLKQSNFQAIRMPYKDKNFGMYVFLPSENGSVESLMKEMNYENWNKWKDQFKAELVDVEMPKLHIELEQELNKMLMGFGMKSAFEPGANFSKMSKGNNLYISLVKQKCYIDVDETGTEAAAATVVKMTLSAGNPNTMEKFIADRPFVYVIADSKTNSILFMGTVEKP